MPTVNGLEDVIAAESEMSFVDGKNGRLVFRGFDAGLLATNFTFEEVAYLLWNGRLPNDDERRDLTNQFNSHKTLPEHLIKLLDLLPEDMDVCTVLRTALSAFSINEPWPPTYEQAIEFTALIPSILTYWHAKMNHFRLVKPDDDMSHVANYLYLIQNGKKPAPEHVQALQTYLILAMEHGMNASTFTARVVTSTESDMASSLVASIGAMKGPLHGGAPSKVMNMLEKIGHRDNIVPWLSEELESGHRLMGFGHRVYKTQDPRAVALREIVKRTKGRDAWFDFAVMVEEEAVRLLQAYKPGRNLYTNVEFWAAAVFRALGIPQDLYTPTFIMGRVVGWTAHILEQASCNRLIRPKALYIGKQP